MSAQEMTILRPVQVVGALHAFRDDKITASFQPGKTIAEIFKIVGVRPQFAVTIFVNGEPQERDYVTRSGDLVNFRVTPKNQILSQGGRIDYGTPLASRGGVYSAPLGQPSSISGLSSTGGGGGFGFLQQIAGWGVGLSSLAGIALMNLLGKAKPNSKSTEISNVISPVADAPTGSEAPPLDGFGGAKDALLPVWTSVSNRENKGGRIPRVYGERYKVFPEVEAHAYTLTEGNENFLRVIYGFGFGQLALSNIRIGDRPIDELAPNVQYEIQYGTGGDAPFTLYTWDVEGSSFNSELIYNASNTRTASQAGDWIACSFSFPNGLYAKDAEGVNIATSCQINIYYRLLGGPTWTLLGSPIYTDNIQSQKVVEFSAPVANGLYEIKIVKATTDGDGPTTFNKVFWTGLKSWSAKNPFRPIIAQSGATIPFCRMALKAKATNELSGALGLCSAEAGSLLRHWNGTTWDAPALSGWPSDIFCDIATGTANYEPVADSLIDLDKILEWHNYCVSKGLKFANVIDSEMSVMDALKTVASAGHAYPANINGKLSVVVDKEQTLAVQLFTPRNIIAGSFTATAQFKRPPDYLKMQFVNPETDWQQDERYVFDDGKDISNSRTHEVMPLVGCIDSNLAWKHGRLQMAANKLRCWTYSFKADIENIICTLGDKIRIRHDLLYWGTGQARISSVTTNGGGDITAISIDSVFEVVAGTGLSVTIRLKDGSLLERQIVVSVTGELTTLTFVTPIPAATAIKPQRGDLLSAGWVECIIVDIQNEPDFVATITCVDYAPGVYTADSGSIPAYQSNITLPHDTNPTIPVPVILSVQSDDTVLTRSTDGAYDTRIYITVAPAPPDILYVEFQYKLSTASTWSNSETASPSAQAISVYGVQDGLEYDVRLRNRDSKQRVSAWNEVIKNHLVIGKAAPPPDQPNNIDREVNSTFIKWFYDSQHGVTVPLDFAGHQLRYNWGNNENWEQGTILAPLTTANRFDLGGMARGLKTVMIKALDVAGNFQAGPPAIIKLDFGDITTENVVIDSERAPTFEGVLTNCHIDAGKLKNDDDGSLFWGADTSPFWGADNELFWDGAFIEGVYEWSYTPPVTEQKPFRVLVVEDITGLYKLEYQTLGNSLFWGADGDLFWGADTDLFWDALPDNPWLPLPADGLVGDYVKYNFRLTLFAGPNQVVVNSLKDRLDVPDITEYVDNFLVSNTAGSRPALSKTYRFIKTASATLQKDAGHPAAFAVQVLDKNKIGPLIQTLDSTGSGVTGIVDLIVRGY